MWESWTTASSCHRGFVMDDSVKDQLPTADDPAPQFSLGSTWKIPFRSLNDDPTWPEGVDERPNFWARPEGNYAQLEMNGWKVHHTNEKNWGRNCLLFYDDWQLSDNSQGTKSIRKIQIGFQSDFRFHTREQPRIRHQIVRSRTRCEKGLFKFALRGND